MNSIRGRIVLWLFPLALSLAQAGGLVHGVSHVVADIVGTQASDGAGKARAGTSADLCSLCASFAKVAHAAHVGPVDTIAVALDTLDSPAPSTAPIVRATIVPRSRGPPLDL